MSGVDVLGYSSFLVSIIGILLNAKKKIACWPVWLVSNSGWIVYSILQKGYSSSNIMDSLFSLKCLWMVSMEKGF